MAIEKLEIYRDPEEDLKTEAAINKWINRLSLLALIVIPLLMRIHSAIFYSPTISGTVYSLGSKTEIFSYYKFLFTLIFAVILLSLFVYRLIATGKMIKLTQTNVAIYLFIVTVLLSFVFSTYKNIAFLGLYDRYTGTVTMLCYSLIFLILLNTKIERGQSLLIYSTIPFIIVNTALGLLNFLGINIINNPIVYKLIIGNANKKSLNAGAHIVTTLNNPDYISGIASVLLAIFLYLFLVEKRWLTKTAYVIMALMSYTMILTSYATSGFFTFVVSLPILFIVLFITKKLSIKKILIVLSILVIFVVETVGLSIHNQQVWNGSFGYFIKTNPIKILKQHGLEHAFSDNVSYFENVAHADQAPAFSVPKLPHSGYSAGSGRLYIWKQTLHLVSSKPVIGYGFNTYPYIFNQNDPQKNAGLGNYNIIVDKPHDIYLDLAYGAGLVSVVIFLAMVLTVFKKVYNYLRTSKNEKEMIIVVALFLGVVAFLIQGLFNDFITGNAIFFWIMLGWLGSLVCTNNPTEQ